MDMNTMNKPAFGDQDILTDMLSTQKFVTDGYNTYSNECATQALRTDFMNILKEEHCIQSDVFSEMQKRGWYPTEAADQNKVNQAKQKYQGMSL